MMPVNIFPIKFLNEVHVISDVFHLLFICHMATHNIVHVTLSLTSSYMSCSLTSY